MVVHYSRVIFIINFCVAFSQTIQINSLQFRCSIPADTYRDFKMEYAYDEGAKTSSTTALTETQF